MNESKLMITANSPRITDQVGPLLADAQHLAGWIIVALPDAETFLGSPSQAADLELAKCLRFLNDKYPDRRLGLAGWLPLRGWVQTGVYLLGVDFELLQPVAFTRWMDALRRSTESN
jgi:hypothetical protein